MDAGIIAHIAHHPYTVTMRRASLLLWFLLLASPWVATMACGGSEYNGATEGPPVIRAATANSKATLTAISGAPDPSAATRARSGDPEPANAMPMGPGATRAALASAGPTPITARVVSPETDPDTPHQGIRRDFRSLQNAEYLLQSEPESAKAIAALPWLADGVAASEVVGAESLTQLAAFHGPLFWSLVGRPWLQDGLDDSEAATAQNLLIIAQRNPAAAERVAGLPWLAGTVTRNAEAIVRDLALIAQSDPNAALRIANMPFTQAIDAPDAAALRSLQVIAFRDLELFQDILNHPSLRGGITNDWAMIIATLAGVARTNPSLIGALLDPDRVTVETRAVELPLSGATLLAIIRTGPGSARSMDLLHSSALHAEEFMQEELPTDYVGLLFELAVPGSSTGVNVGSSIAIRPQYDVDDGSHEAEVAGLIIAHEVAHYYWNNNADWIDEGAAELMASVSEADRAGRPLDANNYPCAYVNNIAELESLAATLDSDPFACNYSLGERLFLDLYRNLGDADFQRGFRELYRLSLAEHDADGLARKLPGIENLRTAFGAPTNDDIEAIIARWYDGSAPFGATGLDASAVDAALPNVDGRIDRAYIAVGKTGQPVAGFSARDASAPVFLTLEYSYRVTGDPVDIPLQLVESYQDGFVFSRRDFAINAASQYRGGTQWLSIGPGSGEPWAPGQHRARVYHGSRMLAHVEYVVTP